MSKDKVLFIEDDQGIAGLVELELKHEGYDVELAADGRIGLDRALEQTWDIILLDVMLPGISGLEVCRRIRAESRVPIIMVTAKGAVSDRIAGLDFGADDYLVKPFAIEELMARMRGLMRRASYGSEGNAVLRLANLEMNLETRQVVRDGAAIQLTPREFALLQFFLENRAHVLSRDTILRNVWGYDFTGETNVVDVYVRYLRAKIDDGHAQPLLHTVRGVGYTLKEA